jgi:hypothetical protein
MRDPFSCSTDLTPEMLITIKDMKLDGTCTLILHLATSYQCFLRKMKQKGENQPFEEWDLKKTMDIFFPHGVPQEGVL